MVGRDLKTHLFPLSTTGRETLHCPRVLQGLSKPVQPGLSTWTLPLVNRGAAACPRSQLQVTRAADRGERTSREGRGTTDDRGNCSSLSRDPLGCTAARAGATREIQAFRPCSLAPGAEAAGGYLGRALFLALPCSSCAHQGHTCSALHDLWVVPTLCPPTPQSSCVSPGSRTQTLHLKDPGQGRETLLPEARTYRCSVTALGVCHRFWAD